METTFIKTSQPKAPMSHNNLLNIHLFIENKITQLNNWDLENEMFLLKLD